jgi:hypothetical protein
MTDSEPLDPDDTVAIDAWAADLTYREVHLAVEGLFDGFRRINPRFSERVQGTVVGDSWYYKAMFVVGYLLKYLLAYGAAQAAGVPLPN